VKRERQRIESQRTSPCTREEATEEMRKRPKVLGENREG
jgi:hypothetical protein